MLTLIPNMDFVFPIESHIDHIAVVVSSQVSSFPVHRQVRTSLWSWPVPTCCWAVGSYRTLFQPSVVQKYWCASWRSVHRLPYLHYAWLRKTKVSECLGSVCGGVSDPMCRSLWGCKVTLIKYRTGRKICIPVTVFCFFKASDAPLFDHRTNMFTVL